MVNIDNVVITTNKSNAEEPIEKKVPFNELSKAQTETLCKAETLVNHIVATLDKSERADDFSMPEVPDFKTTLQINLELSHRITEKLNFIRAILEG